MKDTFLKVFEMVFTYFYAKGYTLDVLITQNTSSVLGGLSNIQDPVLCDNNGNAAGDRFAVHTHLRVAKPLIKRTQDCNFSYIETA